MIKISAYFKSLKEFFPITLLLLHIRRSILLLVFWISLFGVVGGYFFSSLGFQYLFTEPEYMGEVNFWAFLILGVLLGSFTMSFHVSSYIFYSYRFPFLATLNRPLYRFAINNSIIPLLFILFLNYSIFREEWSNGYQIGEILLNLAGLNSGIILSVSLVFSYFFSTLKTIDFDSAPNSNPLGFLIKQDQKMPDVKFTGHVTTYLRNFWKLRYTRGVQHYAPQDLISALQKHHFNAALFFVANIMVLFGLSAFGNFKYLQIPAGASLILILTIYLMLMGAVFSRFKTWTYVLVIAALFIINFFSGFSIFQKRHYAPGLSYHKQAIYSYPALKAITNEDILQSDLAEGLKVLENWRSKFPKDQPPKLVVINSSGGGLRSSLFTLSGLLTIDSITEGDFFEHMHLITGSSGGMIGASYFREVKRKGNESKILPYYKDLGEDLLNPIGFNMAVNDLFVPFRSFKKYGQRYPIDRGISFDQKLNENTNGWFDKSIGFYEKQELSAEIPSLILSPTIISDGRRLIISPRKMSYLTVNKNPFIEVYRNEVDGVEFSRLFEMQNPDSLWLPTALRMSASFPYITPLISFPSSPRIEVIDAGARDNTGFELSLRYLYHYRDWISENTSGVLFVQFLANNPDAGEISGTPYKTRLDALVKPIGGVVKSFSNLQEFTEAKWVQLASHWAEFPLKIVRVPLNLETDVSLSWHLTRNEKRAVLRRIAEEDCQNSFQEIQQYLNSDSTDAQN